MDDRAQTSAEYILLVAFGLVVVMAAIALATQIKAIGDLTTQRIQSDRNELIAMLG